MLGRDRDFDAPTRKVIYDALEQLGLGTDRLVLSRNKNCPAVFKYVKNDPLFELELQTFPPSHSAHRPIISSRIFRTKLLVGGM